MLPTSAWAGPAVGIRVHKPSEPHRSQECPVLYYHPHNSHSGSAETFTPSEMGENRVSRGEKTLGLRSRQLSEGKEGIRM